MAGIYLHIPFCRQACTYCNFHFSTQLVHKSALIDAMCREIEKSDKFIDTEEPIASVYFGGGTPSLLTESELVLLMDAIQKKIRLVEDVEITLEANPDDVSKEKARVWKKTGINRLSLGIQSFIDDELRMMHRAHDAKQAIDSIHYLQEVGLENISTDLIFGIPNQTDESISGHLQLLKQLNIPHVSCYALTIEEKTILHHQIKKRQYPDVNNDQQARQFLLIHEQLTSLGYDHYEISNYGLPGKHSRHNSSYWQSKPYWGFGPSAHAYDGKQKRRWNIANNAEYIKAMNQHLPFFTEEELSSAQQYNEYIMTRLRTREGIDLNELENKFCADKKELLLSSVKPFELAHQLMIEENFIRLTRDGMLFADGIASDLFIE